MAGQVFVQHLTTGCCDPSGLPVGFETHIPFDEVSIYNFILIIVFESFVINIKSYLTSMNSNAQVSPMLGKN